MPVTEAHAPDRAVAPFARVGAVTERLRHSTGVADLLAAAADAVRVECGFSRAVVLGVGERAFNAADSDPLRDPASDRLRRLVLSRPIPIARGSVEERLVLAAEQGCPSSGGASSTLACALELGHHVLTPIMLDGRVAAMLVLDRDLPEVRPAERALASSYAAIIGLLLEQRLLRSRVTDVASELRRLTAFTHALMRESSEGQLTLPSDRDASLSLPGVLAQVNTPVTRWDYKLTGQELRVAKLLASGRSNREIAAELVLSVDTVKSHVARVLQKLGVANRAQAAVLFVNGPGDRRAARIHSEG